MKLPPLARPFLTLAFGALLAACGATPEVAPPPSTRTSAAPVTVTATSGPLSLQITVAPDSAPPTVTPTAEGASTVSATISETPLRVDLEAGWRFVANTDGSLTVTDSTGTPVGGLAIAPPNASGAGAAGIRLTALGDTSAELSPPRMTSGPTTTAEPKAPAKVDLSFGSTGLRSATWGTREGGRSIAVDPTAWARSAGIAGTDTAWAQLIAAEPEVNTATMRDQFYCHAIGAREKATWNLEPWRPNVGLLATAAARCNPT